MTAQDKTTMRQALWVTIGVSIGVFIYLHANEKEVHDGIEPDFFLGSKVGRLQRRLPEVALADEQLRPRHVRYGTTRQRGSGSCGAPSSRRNNPNRVPAPTHLDLLSGRGLEAVLDYIWAKESSCGKDPRARRGFRGPAGERGGWQWTPIFKDDLIMLRIVVGKKPDPYGPDCRRLTGQWLQIRANEVEWRSIYDLHNLYKRGASGYREWKEK